MIILPISGTQRLYYIFGLIGVFSIAYTLYSTYNSNERIFKKEQSEQNTRSYINTIESFDQEFYQKTFKNFIITSPENHLSYTRMAQEIENLNLVNNFYSKNIVDEAWYNIFKLWVNNEGFKLFWEKNYIFFDKETDLFIKKLQTI
jgi:hypothetical protein